MASLALRFFSTDFLTDTIHGTGIFTYIYHRNQPNVGKYTIHGSYGLWFSLVIFIKSFLCLVLSGAVWTTHGGDVSRWYHDISKWIRIVKQLFMEEIGSKQGLVWGDILFPKMTTLLWVICLLQLSLLGCVFAPSDSDTVDGRKTERQAWKDH